MLTAHLVYQYLDSIMPFETQEPWDNSGVLVNSGKSGNKILICLDVTKQAIDYAVSRQVNLIISHHPVVFQPIKKIDCQDILYQLIAHNISVICAHTNFDKYIGGTCSALADAAGLSGQREYLPIGIVGSLKTAQSLQQLAQQIKTFTQAPVQFTQNFEKNIQRIMVVAGSGSGMIQEVLACKADCFVTGECKYHDILDLAQSEIAVITVGHDMSEFLSLKTLQQLLKRQFCNAEIEIYQTNPLTKTI